MDIDPVDIEHILSLLAQTQGRISTISTRYENTRRMAQHEGEHYEQLENLLGPK